MSDAGEFVDAALRREGSPERAHEVRSRLGGDLRSYGATVGAVRGTVRDAARRYPGLTHDDVTALSSELWAVPVFERRLAAIVFLQSKLRELGGSDLTRIEGFVRSTRLRALVDPLAIDVIGPLVGRLEAPARARAEVVLDRWARGDEVWLRRAALISPVRALRAGGGDWPAFTRRASTALPVATDGTDAAGGAPGDAVVREAVEFVLGEVRRSRPELLAGS